MAHAYFHPHHQELRKKAVVMVEEMTADFFKLTQGHRLRARYDILTLEVLEKEEISPNAPAMVAKYCGRPQEANYLRPVSIFTASVLRSIISLRPGSKGGAAPVFPVGLCLDHELRHMVRFSRFLARFETSPAEKRRKEEQVHRLTRKILAPLNFVALPPVICYIL